MIWRIFSSNFHAASLRLKLGGFVDIKRVQYRTRTWWWPGGRRWGCRPAAWGLATAGSTASPHPHSSHPAATTILVTSCTPFLIQRCEISRPSRRFLMPMKSKIKIQKSLKYKKCVIFHFTLFFAQFFLKIHMRTYFKKTNSCPQKQNRKCFFIILKNFKSICDSNSSKIKKVFFTSNLNFHGQNAKLQDNTISKNLRIPHSTR